MISDRNLTVNTVEFFRIILFLKVSDNFFLLFDPNICNISACGTSYFMCNDLDIISDTLKTWSDNIYAINNFLIVITISHLIFFHLKINMNYKSTWTHNKYINKRIKATQFSTFSLHESSTTKNNYDLAFDGHLRSM